MLYSDCSKWPAYGCIAYCSKEHSIQSSNHPILVNEVISPCLYWIFFAPMCFFKRVCAENSRTGWVIIVAPIELDSQGEALSNGMRITFHALADYEFSIFEQQEHKQRM